MRINFLGKKQHDVPASWKTILRQSSVDLGEKRSIFMRKNVLGSWENWSTFRRKCSIFMRKLFKVKEKIVPNTKKKMSRFTRKILS